MDRSYDRDHEREMDRDYQRFREVDHRHEDKRYDSPYERGRHDDRRYMEIDHYSETSRDDRLPMDAHDYGDDRRSRREMWDMRNERELEREREIDHRRYGREDSRPPPPQAMKPRDWGDADYQENEWDRRRGVDWERETWDTREHEHPQIEEEWRHYNRSMDSWPEDRRRWPSTTDWRERSRPRSQTSHNREGNF